MSNAMTAPKPSYFRMSISDFRRSAFKGRPPSPNTIKAAIRDRTWAGEKVGNLYYIFVDDDGQPLPGKPAAPQTGNPAADALIMDWLANKK
jgi:hypothetical protein